MRTLVQIFGNRQPVLWKREGGLITSSEVKSLMSLIDINLIKVSVCMFEVGSRTVRARGSYSLDVFV